MTRYTFEHAEVQIFLRGPFAIVEVRWRVPKKQEPEPWLAFATLKAEPSMGEMQQRLAGTEWSTSAEPPAK